MQIIELLLVAFKQLLIVGFGLRSSVMLMILDAACPWESCSGFQKWVNLTCFGPTLRTYLHQRALLWTWGPHAMCCVLRLVCAPIFSSCGCWEVGERQSDLSLSWSGHLTKSVPTEEKASARHPLPCQGRVGEGAYFRYSDTLQRGILSVGYVGCLWSLDWVTCLNLEKRNIS